MTKYRTVTKQTRKTVVFISIDQQVMSGEYRSVISYELPSYRRWQQVT